MPIGIRKLNVDWVLDIKDQCQNGHTKFFFKQWGGTNKKKAGWLIDGKTYQEMPEFERQMAGCKI
ncbi:MAG: DUF5131 family protein [Bacteroidia bacterium]|nr:DUF5131 family protein [Bacteroidia bacterium]